MTLLMKVTDENMADNTELVGWPEFSLQFVDIKITAAITTAAAAADDDHTCSIILLLLIQIPRIKQVNFTTE